MKNFLITMLFLAFSSTISAQDTIFVKSGEIIPAVIVEKNNTEIKYKKSGQANSTAVYSVFVSDVASIHYKDGIIADYSLAGQPFGQTSKRPIDYAGTMKVIRLSIGFTGEFANRVPSDDLLTWWRFYTGKSKAVINCNPVSFPVDLKMIFVLGNSGRNWLGDELQLIVTPKDALNASEYEDTCKLRLTNFYYNITLFYGHTINHKRTVAAIFEPGFDLSFMSGTFKFIDNIYKETGTVGMGFHTAIGIDWLITPRVTLSCRAGYRQQRIKEQHDGPNGYSHFTIPPDNVKRMVIDWKGPFASIGLNFNFYTKMKGMKLD
jgi:hypothetical protein